MKKKLTLAFLSVIASLGILGVEAAQADSYRAGEFTITITGDHYHGCDRKGNCLDLDQFQKWKHNGRRGIFWINGDYSYGLSWLENAPDSGRFVVTVGNGKKLLERKLVPLD